MSLTKSGKYLSEFAGKVRSSEIKASKPFYYGLVTTSLLIMERLNADFKEAFFQDFFRCWKIDVNDFVGSSASYVYRLTSVTDTTNNCSLRTARRARSVEQFNHRRARSEFGVP